LAKNGTPVTWILSSKMWMPTFTLAVWSEAMMVKNHTFGLILFLAFPYLSGIFCYTFWYFCHHSFWSTIFNFFISTGSCLFVITDHNLVSCVKENLCIPTYLVSCIKFLHPQTELLYVWSCATEYFMNLILSPPF
jgi:hypothetical protein